MAKSSNKNRGGSIRQSKASPKKTSGKGARGSMAPRSKLAPPVRKESKGPTGRPIVGIHAVKECLLVSTGPAQLLWVKEGAESPELAEIRELALQKRVPVKECSQGQLDNIASQHQNLCLFAPPAPILSVDDLTGHPSRILAVDQLEDPHNLGALIRTAWLMGVDGILLTERRSVGLTPAVHKVASGGVEHVPLLWVDNFAPIFERLKEKGYWIFGLAAEGAQSLYQQKFPDQVVIVIGSEDSGLRKSTRGFCDELVAIPQHSQSASYNASVAGAITLSEVFRQHSAIVSSESRDKAY